MQKLLVLGVGNILLMDEGIGVKAVTELLGETWPENVTFIDGGTFTQDIFYLFQEYDHLIILDVVRTGKEPGTIFRLSEDDLVQNEDQSLSLHDIDLLDSLRMAELLGNRPTLTIIGIEPEKIDWSMELTPTLEKAYPKFLEAARREIRSQLEAM
ncbi:MAG: NiFeSe hydrogenase maturation protease, partial [Desulfovibrionales bacterium]